MIPADLLARLQEADPDLQKAGGGMGMNDDWWLTIDDPVELGKVIAERALIAVMEAMQ